MGGNWSGVLKSVERVGVNKEVLKRIGTRVSVMDRRFAANNEMGDHQG